MTTTTETVTITLTRKQAVLIEDAIQFSAVSILQSQDTLDTEAKDYRANRDVFGIVYDAIYDATEGL